MCFSFRIAGILVALAGIMIVQIPKSFAGSANVSFSGQIPCALAKQRCDMATREQYVFADTAGIEYTVQNRGAEPMSVYPVVKGAEIMPIIQPEMRVLAPHETARFIVYWPMARAGQSRVEVCARTGNNQLRSCQTFRAIAVR